MKKASLCTILLAVVVLCVALPQAFGQITEGRITGRVVDTSGAVIPGATVTAMANATGYTYTVKTGAAGNYTFEAVDPGVYTLLVQAKGFEQGVVNNVEVHAQATISQEVKLRIGAVTEKVTVTAGAPLLETQDASIGATITGRQVNDMPLAGRDFTQLGMLAPGTITGGGSSTSTYTSLGDDFVQNDFRLNGIDDNVEMYGAGQVQGVSGNVGTAVIPPPDAIEEFKFQSGDYSAEFGHSTGAVINAQIKSGTNHLHGALWEYARNTDFNANSFANKNQTPIVPRSPYHENQYGFTVGGPVFIPKLYDGRNKTFFFVSWQYSGISTPNQMTSSVPTPGMVSSNFTNFQDYLDPSYISGTKTDALGRVFPNGTIFDPETARYVAANGNDPVTGLPNQWGIPTYVSDPFYTGGSIGQTMNFTGLTQYLNQLPAGRLDPNAVKLLAAYPGQNTHPAGYGTENYYRSADSTNDLSQFDLRIDQHFGDKDLFFGTFDQSNNTRFEPSPLPGILDGGGYGTGYLQGPRYGISLGYTHVFTPTLTNEFHAGWLHNIERLEGINGNTMGIPEQFGIGGIPQVPGNGGLPNIYDGFTATGQAGYVPTLETITSLELMDNVTKVFSKHTLKVGYQINHIKAPIVQPAQGNGFLDYNGQFTDIPNAGTGTTAYADMLLVPGATQYPQYGGVNNLGGLDEDYITNYTTTRYQRVYMGAYVQDDWRVTPKLTLNLGLRWDLTTPYTDVDGHAANFVENGGGAGTTATYLIAKGGCSTTLSPGFTALLEQDGIAIKCAGSNGISDYQHFNFAPRVGFAWSPTYHTVVRGGYGITYGALDNVGYGPLGQNYPFEVQYFGYSPVFQTPATTPEGATAVMENAFTAPGLLDPSAEPESYFEGSSFAGRAYNLHTAYIQTYNLTVQHQFTAHDAFSLGYVGTLGRHLDSSSGNNATSAIMPPGTNAYDPTVQGHVPFPDFTGGYEQTDNAASAYNSMQAVAQHQFSRGFDLSANWTWSKCMSDQQSPQGQRSGSSGYRAPWLPGFGIKGDWGLCGYDAARVTHVSGTWHLPVGRGQELLGNTNHLTDAFLGGWVMNLIYMDQSGQPVNVGCPVGTTANFGCNANVVPGVSVYPRNRNALHWLNYAAFSQPPMATQIGQTNFAPLGGGPDQARGPAFQNIDMSMFKQFQVHDTTKFEFRAEAFNVGNWTQYAGPSNLNFTNTSNFAALLGTRNNNRILQLALKFYY